MSDGADPTETLASLTKGLESVEETLKPLLDGKWTETTGSLSTLERAKMDVLVSYAINDLIWVYLKMKGVDPSTHEVSGELERIRTYYGKVKAVEEPESRRTTQIDKAAAGRLVAHSIPKKQRLPALPTTATTSAAAVARAQAEAAVTEHDVGTSSRFKHIVKDGETERVGAGAGADSESEDSEEEGGDEAEELLNDLQEQYEASRGLGSGNTENGDKEEVDRRKRRRAEDLNK